MAYGKRLRQKAEEMVWLPDGADVARFLLLFSGHQQQHYHGSGAASTAATASAPERVFECKTCSRQFPSFQALGGHRASHKKPRLADGGLLDAAAAEPPKPKVHGCSICGLEFAIGQALGGHMRRHRAAEADGGVGVGGSPGLGLGLSLGPKGDRDKKAVPSAPELVLDLNAVPELEEEQDRAKLGLPIEFPVPVVDFLR